MGGVNLEPAMAGWLGIALAAIVVAGAGALLRVITLCRHHLERLEFLDKEERRLDARHRAHVEKVARAEAHAAAKAALLTGQRRPA